MAITFEGKEYMVGPAAMFHSAPAGYDDVGRVQHMGQSCVVLRHPKTGSMYLHVQYANAQWPSFLPLRTKADLLQGWS